MSNEGRGMVKYAPYQSLVEQSKVLAKMRQDRQRCPKRLLSSDAAEEINEILVHYESEPVSVVFWRNGFFYEERGVIQRIDAQNERIQINGMLVQFREFQSLKRI